MRRIIGRVALLVVLATAGASVPAGEAQETRLEVRADDSIKSLLERQMGKRVSLVLEAGPEMTGVVSRVGDSVVLLTELSGREFSDAAVPLDRIVAVVVRVRGR